MPKSLRNTTCLISQVILGRGLSTLCIKTISLVSKVYSSKVKVVLGPTKYIFHFSGSLVLGSLNQNT